LARQDRLQQFIPIPGKDPVLDRQTTGGKDGTKSPRRPVERP
jgi:hypothetical protein